MAKTITPAYPQSITAAGIEFVNADGTTAQDLISAGTNDSIITRISAHSDDTADIAFTLYLHDGTTAWPVGSIEVTAGAGTDGALPAENLLDNLLLEWLDDKKQIALPSGWKIQLAAQTAVTAAKTITFVAIGDDY